MKWVKASERLPETEGMFTVVAAYSMEEESRHFDGKHFTNYSGYRVLFWLDESESPAPAGKSKTMEAYLMKHMVENKASFTSNELHTVLNAMSEYAAQQCAEKDARIAELREALENLIALKQWKDRYGKDEHYTKLQPAAWESAKAALNP